MFFAWAFHGQRAFHHTLFPLHACRVGETECLQHCLTFVGGEDEEDGGAWLEAGCVSRLGRGPVGLHAVLCSLVDMNLPCPSLPDVFLSAHTSCLGGSCFKECSKKYIYICWGFPTGHFLNSSFTSVKREKNTYLLHFCTCVCLLLIRSPSFLSPPFLSLPFSPLRTEDKGDGHLASATNRSSVTGNVFS